LDLETAAPASTVKRSISCRWHLSCTQMPIKGTFTLDIVYWSSPQSVSSIVLEFWPVNPNFVLQGYFVATGSYGWNSTSVIAAAVPI
jgi:hypothetical protein